MGVAGAPTVGLSSHAPGVLVMVGTLGDRAGDAPGSLANWYLTIGDTDNSAATATGELGTSAQMGIATPLALVLS